MAAAPATNAPQTIEVGNAIPPTAATWMQTQSATAPTKTLAADKTLSDSPVGERPPDERTSGLANRYEADVGDDVGELEPIHSGKPTCNPLALDRPYRPDHNRSERRKSSKDRVAQDEWQAVVLIRHIASDGCWCGNQQRGQDSAERRQSGQQDKQRPPSVRRARRVPPDRPSRARRALRPL